MYKLIAHLCVGGVHAVSTELAVVIILILATKTYFRYSHYKRPEMSLSGKYKNDCIERESTVQVNVSHHQSSQYAIR